MKRRTNQSNKHAHAASRDRIKHIFDGRFRFLSDLMLRARYRAQKVSSKEDKHYGYYDGRFQYNRALIAFKRNHLLRLVNCTHVPTF